MSVGLRSTPTSPNKAYTKLPYVAYSRGYTSSSYSYVMDVYEEGNSEKIARVLTSPNPVGDGVFDASVIVQGAIDYDSPWKAKGAVTTLGKTFTLKFGEAWAATDTSPLVFYPDQQTETIELIPGTVDPSQAYNWDREGYVYTGSLSGANDLKIGLTQDPYKIVTGSNRVFPGNERQTYPVKVVNKDDYDTISFYNFDDSSDTDSLSVDNVTIWVIQENGTIAWRYFGDYPLSSSLDPFVTHGVGPKNLRGVSGTFFSGSKFGTTGNYDSEFDDNLWFKLSVSITTGGQASRTFSYTLVNESYTNEQIKSNMFAGVSGYEGTEILIDRPNECNDKNVFTFINEFGTWDYYNNFYPISRVTDIQRDAFNKPSLDYSNAAVSYDQTERGFTYYNTNSDDTYTVSTGYIDQYQAQYIKKMIESPRVLIKKDDDFVPIVITNSSVTENLSTSRNKLFEYTITFRPSKGRELL